MRPVKPRKHGLWSNRWTQPSRPDQIEGFQTTDSPCGTHGLRGNVHLFDHFRVPGKYSDVLNLVHFGATLSWQDRAKLRPKMGAALGTIVVESCCVKKRSDTKPVERSISKNPKVRLLLFFFTLVTGPGRSLSLELSDTRVYEPQVRSRLGTTAHFCEEWSISKKPKVRLCASTRHSPGGAARRGHGVCAQGHPSTPRTGQEPPWRQPKGKSEVNLPQMPPDSGSICMAVD